MQLVRRSPVPEIIVLPDNDDAGRKHADTIGAAFAAVGRTIRILDLPGLENKEDVLDWYDRGGTREQLDDLIGSDARPWEPGKRESVNAGPSSDSYREQRKPVPVKIYTYDEMVALPEADFLIDGVIVRRGKNVIFGASNTFKSFHAVDLGCSVSTGRSYHGKAVRKMKIFYAANEGAIGIGRKRPHERKRHATATRVTPIVRHERHFFRREPIALESVRKVDY